MKRWGTAVSLVLALVGGGVLAEGAEKVVDVPSRDGVTQRMLVTLPPNPSAAVLLLPGGHGGLQIFPNGSLKWGENNFLVRTRSLFAQQGFAVAVLDAPSDRQQPPYLGGFRQKPEHVADIKAALGWLREQTKAPVWLVGTSRGTQSAAFAATQIAPADGGPDGLVLTSTILADDGGRPVPAMPLKRIAIPVLVVHHENDGCKHCPYAEAPKLVDKLDAAPRKALITVTGGRSTGDPCEAMAHHGFNGNEADVVAKIAGWIHAR